MILFFVCGRNENEDMIFLYIESSVIFSVNKVINKKKYKFVITLKSCLLSAIFIITGKN